MRSAEAKMVTVRINVETGAKVEFVRGSYWVVNDRNDELSVYSETESKPLGTFKRWEYVIKT
jgi:hypothetical protein